MSAVQKARLVEFEGGGGDVAAEPSAGTRCEAAILGIVRPSATCRPGAADQGVQS